MITKTLPCWFTVVFLSSTVFGLHPLTVGAQDLAEGRRLLQASDIVYEGTYRMRGGDDVFGRCLTHRYVDNKLRFIYLAHAARQANVHLPVEITLPSKFNEEVKILTDWQHYSNFWIDWSNVICHTSLWWEDGEERLWTCSGFDYPQGEIGRDGTQSIYTRKLPSVGGACVEHSGWFGVEGIGQRALWGKIQRVPKWFQRKYVVGPYASLGGGYTSLMAQGLGPSLGPFFVCLPELHGTYKPSSSYTSSFNVPAKDVAVLADMRSGTKRDDWYANGFKKRASDRGVRLSPVTNEYDGGAWLSPAPGDPDGFGRWTWGDSYRDTGNWIDNDEGSLSRHGIVLLASLNRGRCWYESSTGHAEFQSIELHIFDPEDLGKVRQGQLAPFKVRPKVVKILTELDQFLNPESNPQQVGATYDSIGKKLYVMTYYGRSTINYLHQYAVDVGK